MHCCIVIKREVQSDTQIVLSKMHATHNINLQHPAPWNGAFSATKCTQTYLIYGDNYGRLNMIGRERANRALIGCDKQ